MPAMQEANPDCDTGGCEPGKNGNSGNKRGVEKTPSLWLVMTLTRPEVKKNYIN